MRRSCLVLSLTVVVGVVGCGGSTKTVVQTVTAPATSSSTSSSTTTSPSTTTTSAGPPSCEGVLRPQGGPAVTQDLRPTVCDASNGAFWKIGTENYPLKLKSLTVQFVGARSATTVSDSSAASATANGTFEIITLRVTNNSATPQTMESVGGNTVTLQTLGSNTKTYSESFQAENQADQNSFVSQNTTPIQPDASQTGDVVFDLPAPALASIRRGGAGLVFGDFGTDLTTDSASNDPSRPFGLIIIHHVKLQG